MRFLVFLVVVFPVLLLSQEGRARSAWMMEKQLVNAPNGYKKLCANRQEVCQTPPDATAVAGLQSNGFQQLLKFNQKMNLRISYNSDERLYGQRDHWQVATESGDCEDIALAKRVALVDAGWPPGALWLAIGVIPGGQAHVVLVLRSDHGDLVFDNRTDDLLLWHETNLRFLARQVPGDPRFWRRLVSPL